MLKAAKPIPAQAAVAPQNCGAATALLLGLISPEQANEMTRKGEGKSTAEWLGLLNDHPPAGVTYSSVEMPLTDDNLHNIASNLFLASATVVLTTENNKPMGHYFVLARDTNSTVVVFDLQMGLCAANPVDFNNYIEFVHPGMKPGGGRITVFGADQERTAEQVARDAYILRGQTEKMNGAGSSRRPSSLLTRRAGRSSRKRHYSRRRRASRTGRHRN